MLRLNTRTRTRIELSPLGSIVALVGALIGAVSLYWSGVAFGSQQSDTDAVTIALGDAKGIMPNEGQRSSGALIGLNASPRPYLYVDGRRLSGEHLGPIRFKGNSNVQEGFLVRFTALSEFQIRNLKMLSSSWEGKTTLSCMSSLCEAMELEAGTAKGGTRPAGLPSSTQEWMLKHGFVDSRGRHVPLELYRYVGTQLSSRMRAPASEKQPVVGYFVFPRSTLGTVYWVGLSRELAPTAAQVPPKFGQNGAPTARK